MKMGNGRWVRHPLVASDLLSNLENRGLTSFSTVSTRRETLA